MKKELEGLVDYFKTAKIDTETYNYKDTNTPCCVAAHLAFYLEGKTLYVEGKRFFREALDIPEGTLNLVMLLCGAGNNWNTHEEWKYPPHEVFRRVLAIKDYANFITTESLKGELRRRMYKYMSLENMKGESLDFTGSYFQDISFEYSFLTECKFNTSHIRLTNFTDSNLTACDFAHSYIDDTRFNKASLINCTLLYTYLHEIESSDVEIINANFNHSHLKHVTFSVSNMDLVRIKNAYLYVVRFGNCYLRRTDFYESNLEDVYFYRAKLTSVSFKNTVLKNVDFSLAKFKNVDFTGAVLDNVKLPDSIRGSDTIEKALSVNNVEYIYEV